MRLRPALFILGSCVFIGFLNWALIPMYYAVDFKVVWPNSLFKSRLHLSCRDLIYVATSWCCHDINLRSCSLQLMSSDVATSISCRDITLCLCRFQLVVLGVATSISCRDIGSKNCNFQLSMSDVATSSPCRDINLYLLRLLLLFSGVAISVFCRDISLSFGSFISRNLS